MFVFSRFEIGVPSSLRILEIYLWISICNASQGLSPMPLSHFLQNALPKSSDLDAMKYVLKSNQNETNKNEQFHNESLSSSHSISVNDVLHTFSLKVICFLV